MKKVKDLHSKKHSSKMLKIKMNGNTSYVCELEDLILLQWHYSQSDL